MCLQKRCHCDNFLCYTGTRRGPHTHLPVGHVCPGPIRLVEVPDLYVMVEGASPRMEVGCEDGTNKKEGRTSAARQLDMHEGDGTRNTTWAGPA